MLLVIDPARLLRKTISRVAARSRWGRKVARWDAVAEELQQQYPELRERVAKEAVERLGPVLPRLVVEVPEPARLDGLTVDRLRRAGSD